MTGRVVVLLCLLGLSASGAAQPATAPPPNPPPPLIRRWLDVQQISLASRFRWVETGDGRLTSSTVQWQPHLRARLLFDRQARYSVNVGIFSGNQFISGWNNTGAGVGRYGGDVNAKQLFFSAEPVKGWEGQIGGLYLVRGENTELTSYDNDGFIMAERLTYRPARGRITQVTVTSGFLGDIRRPNVFRRFKHLDEWNYGQLLVGARVHARANVSADYTYENGRDILREGVTLRLPDRAPVLTALKVDLYQRVSPDTKHGFNASADLRPARPLTITAGVASIDRRYGALNGDRYDFGTRVYSIGSYALTSDLALGYFVTKGFNNEGAIPIDKRWEILVTYNPTATLKRHRVF